MPAATAAGTAPTAAATGTTAPTAAATTAPTAAATMPAAAATPIAAATTSAAATTPTAAATTPAAAATTTATQCPPAATGAADLALTNPVDPTGAAISLNQSAAQATNSLNCTLTVPANPLTAAGLATPWELGDGCSEANGSQQAFVEATILSPAGQLSVYNPLVITQGTTAAAAPTAPTLDAGSTVIIDVGFNGNNLVLQGDGATQGNCIDAFGDSIISQTSACNAAAFYTAANAAVANGTLTVPALGTDSNGNACESTRSFSLIDQDQSDNVNSVYLLNGNGQTAQATAANVTAMGGATKITNGSDDALLGEFVDPALGCTPFTATDTTNPNGTANAEALNVLSAQNQANTPADLPPNDPQLLVGGAFSLGKTNTYRALTDETPLAANADLNQTAATYCQNMVNIQPAKLQGDMAKEAAFASPVPATGSNLATFMGARLSGSFGNLNCQNFGLTNPATVTVDGNGVATAVTYTTTQQQATVPAAMPANGPAGGAGNNPVVPAGRKGHRENGAGM